APLRAQQGAHLALEEPALAFAPTPTDEDEVVIAPVSGPIVVSLAELPRVAGGAVVIANELLDNLPIDLTDDGCEVRVGVSGGRLAELLVPVPGAPKGPRVPVQQVAARWVNDARSLGRVVVFDYAATTASMADRPWHEWLRTYRAHERGVEPLDAL